MGNAFSLNQDECVGASHSVFLHAVWGPAQDSGVRKDEWCEASKGSSPVLTPDATSINTQKQREILTHVLASISSEELIDTKSFYKSQLCSK